MNRRRRLPDRRPHLAFEFAHGGHQFTAGVGVYRDGRPAELFLAAAKTGTALHAVSQDCAILLSLALQHGVDLATIRHALSRDRDGSAASPIGRAVDIIAEG